MSFAGLLREAESLQQRAERKRGEAAADLFEQAVARYRQALAAAGSLAAPGAAQALFGLAECLQQGAEAVVAACAQVPDEALTAAAVREADSRAEAMLRESVAVYRRVVEAGQPRVDALVCSGNALCAWAEAAARQDVPAALSLLGEACEAYRCALGREQDALTWSNLADALVQHAELCCEAGQGGQGASLFGQAREAYQRACELSDAAQGDDVPGLLCNWGRGLLAAAQRAQQPGQALELLGEAEQRLRAAASFQRGSCEPLLALGDVLAERGELAAAAGEAGAAAAAFHAALEQGYGAAQRLSAGDPEAAVGTADVEVQLARLAAAGGRGEEAAARWAAAEAGYRAALSRPAALAFRERCDVRYNLACCLARLGRREDAAALLRALLAAGGASAADLAADADLAGVAL